MKSSNYLDDGHCFSQNFFEEDEISLIEPILIKFHDYWMKENHELFSKGAINSHSITSSKHLNKQEKKILFDFISSKKLMDVIEFDDPRFLNTQLFFDPFNSIQNNYWHRDIQYTGISKKEQKEVIKTQNVIHIRVPLKKENGIEIIPETHRKWDSKEEYQVRNSLNNNKSSDSLKDGKLIELERRDMLLFSANIIHRGIYGNGRLSFDILFCDNNPDILKFRDQKNLPLEFEMSELKNYGLFK